MLNQREIEILMELCDHSDEYLTGSYFSDKFNVSLRTIQGDIHEIKQELKGKECIRFVSQTSKGSRVEILDQEAFSVLMSTLYQQYAASSLGFSVSRISQMILLLLYKHRAVTFFELEERFFVSPSTLRNDLKEIEEILQKYDLELFRSKNKVMIDGSETGKRRCLLEQDLNLNHMKDEQGNLFVEERQIDRIKDVLTEVFVTYRYYVMDEDFGNIILFVNILLHRVKNGFYIQPEELDTAEEVVTELEIARSVLKKLGKYDTVKPSELEAVRLAQYLKGKRNHEDSEAISSEMNKFILDALESIRDNFGIDLTDNMNLRIELALHCVSLSARIQYNMQIEKNTWSNIRESFPMGYDLGAYLAYLIGQK